MISRSSLQNIVLALTLSISAGACADNQAASQDPASEGSGWSIDGETFDQGAQDQGTEDALDMSYPRADMTPAPNDMTLLIDLGPEPIDMAPVPEEDMPATLIDFGVDPTPDMPADVDMFTPEDMSGDLTEGDGCGNTNECGDGLLCCASRSGQYECTTERRCFTGGICEISEDCPDQQECCDLSDLGLPNNICRDRCRGMGGGGGGGNTGCTNNTECTGADEVCCPSFQGAAMCVPSSQCQTGGSCATDSDCLNNQACCDFFGQSALCLDQCPF